jgi:23S rRNA (guanosine2251-2'-O)-methyltransferase
MLKKNEIIYGYTPVLEAILSGKEIEKLFIFKSMLAHKAAEMHKVAKQFEIPLQFVPKEKLNKLTNQNHQGVVAIVSSVSYIDIETLLPTLFETGKPPFLLILDKVTDVRNLGSNARTAECAGIDAIIVPYRGSAMINADAVKTSAGALNNINLCRVANLKETIQFLKDSGIQMIAATEKSVTPFYAIDYKNPCAIVMGSEESGISEEYLKMCDKDVQIPMMGETQSLNVAVSTGIILFEGVKQRLN